MAVHTTYNTVLYNDFRFQFEKYLFLFYPGVLHNQKVDQIQMLSSDYLIACIVE